MVLLDKKIIKLYKEKQLSMQQISELLGITTSKVKYTLTKSNVNRRNRSEAITSLNITKYSKRVFKLKEKINSRDEKLKTAGIMLYWGEGTKNGNTVTLSNSDPAMIKVFLKFLRKICGISEERLRILIHMYPDQDDSTLKNFWSSVTEIPKEKFHKSYLHKRKKGTYTKISEYGTVSLRYSDKKLLSVIKIWIQESAQELSK